MDFSELQTAVDARSDSREVLSSHQSYSPGDTTTVVSSTFDGADLLRQVREFLLDKIQRQFEHIQEVLQEYLPRKPASNDERRMPESRAAMPGVTPTSGGLSEGRTALGEARSVSAQQQTGSSADEAVPSSGMHSVPEHQQEIRRVQWADSVAEQSHRAECPAPPANKPQKFGGLPREDVEEWAATMRFQFGDASASAFVLPQAERVRRVVTYFVNGSAAGRWWEQECRDADSFPAAGCRTVEEVLDKAVQRFRDVSAPIRAARRLRGLQQEGSAEAYAERFDRLLLESHQMYWPDDLKRDQFALGLRHHLQAYVQRAIMLAATEGRVATYAEVRQLAIDVDQRQWAAQPQKAREERQSRPWQWGV